MPLNSPKLSAAIPLPSTRLAGWLAAGAVWWVAASFDGVFAWAGMLHLSVLALVAVLDLCLSPQPGQFELSRETPEHMNLGAPNVVTLCASSRARRAVCLTLRDEPPLNFPVTISNLPAGETARVAKTTLDLPASTGGAVRMVESHYRCTPTRRGDFSFGELSARYATALGFWHRQFRRAAPFTARVYPSISEVRRFELRLREGRLRDLGLHVTRWRGRGTQFESLRDYSTDDEFKNINWKASARRGKLISTDYEIERDQCVIIAIDCGRMMTALAVFSGQSSVASDRTPTTDHRPLTSLSKLDCAINATDLLAHVSASMGDGVGLLLFSDTVLKWLPPRKGRLQTGLIIEALYATEAAAAGMVRRAAAVRLDAAMAGELAPLKMERAVFVTEFAEGEPGPDGTDSVTFTVATNPGAPAGPLNRIASGGELSRFLLALKVCLTGDNPGLTLIFDEIDRGVGGATADAVGRRLQALATGAQVLVVTHSPQVAAFGARHWRVEKRVVGDQTVSSVTALDATDRVEEIARMLAGDTVTEAARAAAKALLG